MNWTLQYRDLSWEITDAAALEDQLKELHKENRDSPLIVHLCAPNQACLNVGVGNISSVLNYIAPGGSMSRHSIGDEGASGLLQYEVAHEITEFPARCAIPFDKALEAALHFYSTQELADSIIWEDD